jgi:hypothetical protein
MRTEQITFPEGYGSSTKLLEWEDVRRSLSEAKQYWITIPRPGRSPHVVPVDGLWYEDRLIYGGSPETHHSRAVRAQPMITMHLADPWKVVIVEGEVKTITNPPEQAERLARLNAEKYPEYGMEFDPKLYQQVFALHPARARAWTSFPTDATRFVFD